MRVVSVQEMTDIVNDLNEAAATIHGNYEAELGQFYFSFSYGGDVIVLRLNDEPIWDDEDGLDVFMDDDGNVLDHDEGIAELKNHVLEVVAQLGKNLSEFGALPRYVAPEPKQAVDGIDTPV